MAIFTSVKLFQRRFSTISSNPFRVCVVGSGPAGFYTAEKIIKKHENAEVDIIDRLPTPFGLVRSGVAPDHPDTKIVMNQFSRVVQSERCSFFGNVALGSSIALSELRDVYDVVVLAYGAESDRDLGIPGEELPGIYSAREFVWWYNGHPDYCELEPDLSTDTAVILGQGNVALDVARILLRPTVELAATDIASHAVAALEESCVRKVYLVGRRGPVQAACTAKELRELLGIKGLSVHINEADLVKTPADEEELKNNRIHRRIYELLSEAASSRPFPGQAQRELHFVFFRKPHRFIESDESSSHVAGVQLEKTTVKEDTDSGKRIAIGTGYFESIESGLVLKSIGYKSVPVVGLPFDHDRGVVPNIDGRVTSDNIGDGSHQFEKGLYVCGWLKRGPTGIIGTNMYCAEETVNSISEDIMKGVLIPSTNSKQKPGRNGLLHLLNSRNIKYVPFESWQKIDNEEQARGRLKNKPREKLTTWPELLKTALENWQ